MWEKVSRFLIHPLYTTEQWAVQFYELHKNRQRTYLLVKCVLRKHLSNLIWPMNFTHILKTIFKSSSVFSLLFFLACQEDETVNDPKTSVDECLTKQSVNHGQVIPGEYIVSFKNQSSENGRSARTAA